MRSGSSFLKVAAVGLLILILLVVGAILLLRKKTTSQPATTTPTETETQQNNSEENTTNNLTVTTTVLDQATSLSQKFQDFEQQAYEHARQWKQSASLCAASIKMKADLNPATLTFSYIYCTSEDKTFYYNINFNTQGNFLRALVWQTDYLKPNLLKINRRYLKLSFVDALSLAEQNGGAAFRSGHPEAIVTLNLYRAEPKNYLYWFVRYEDTLSPEQLIKKIDAYSGELVSNE